jgi:hypothetical protein
VYKVRAKLHAFIYRPDELFRNIQEALTAFGAVGYTDARLVAYLRVCSAYLHPLQELMIDDSDATATKRLLQLRTPQREAVWVCSSTTWESQAKSAAPTGGAAVEVAGHLWLEYTHLRKSPTEV